MILKKTIIAVLSIAGACIVELITTAFSIKIVSFFKENNIENLVISFLFDKKFNFLSLFVLFILTIGITLLFVKLYKPKNKSSKIKNCFLKDCPKSIKVNNEIAIEYDVCISDFTGLPTAYNLVIHCSRHNVNTVMASAHHCVYSHSCNYDCEFRNYFSFDFEQSAKEQIQSNLINLWREYNKN